MFPPLVGFRASLLVSLAAIGLAIGGVHGVRAQFAGEPITVEVDAGETVRKILHSHLSMPVKAGPLTLYYPKWIPGEHAPTGPINSLVDLHLSVAGKPLVWQRDPVDLYAFHCEIPEGATALDITLDDVIPTSEGGYSSGTSSSAQLTLINWNQLLLYPAGTPTDRLTYRAGIKLPAGWKFGTALPLSKSIGDQAEFEPVSLTTLVDSPLIAGANFRSIPLTQPGASPGNQMDIVADSAAALALPDDEIAHYKSLVAEAATLYGATHYLHYHFLVALSEHIFHSGIEHHESSLNTLGERTFIDKDERTAESDLLPHEFTHSWNGKYRRPASLTTPDFQVPMQDDMLWVYEGLTEYAGSYVLTGRAGLMDAEWSHDWMASDAASVDHRSGRIWRNLQDCATDAPFLYDAPKEWADLRRGVDFYREGVLLWLEVDTLIRQLSGGEKSIDDFCHIFHGGQSGPPTVITYTFDDVVNTLNAVAPYDWRGLLHERLESFNPHAPLHGLENAGWKLVYNDQPNKLDDAYDEEDKRTDVRYSLGFSLNSEDGTMIDVLANSPAGKVGLGPSMKLVAVNGRAWTPKLLKQALVEAKAPGTPPIELLILNDDFYRSYRLDYHGGEQYPHLERDGSKPDLLAAITAPHAGQPAAATPAP